MLSWYRESPTWLAATVASLTKLGVSHVVCVDGPYQLFPGANAEPCSGAEQADAILQTAHGLGIGCTIHRPDRPFAGNEVEKRSLMFKLALLVAEPGKDWLFWIDADEVVHQAPHDLHERLEATDANVAGVALWQRHDAHATVEQSLQARTLAFTDWTGYDHRVLYRALPGLHCELTHYFVTDGRTYLRGRADMHPLEATLDCSDVVVEHRHEFRDRARTQAADEYYQRRDQMKIEQIAQPHMENVDGELVALP
jgi:hypothetical protein